MLAHLTVQFQKTDLVLYNVISLFCVCNSFDFLLYAHIDKFILTCVQVCLSHLSQLLALMTPWVSRKSLLCPVTWYLYLKINNNCLCCCLSAALLAWLCSRAEDRWALFKKKLHWYKRLSQPRTQNSFEVLNRFL